MTISVLIALLAVFHTPFHESKSTAVDYTRPAAVIGSPVHKSHPSKSTPKPALVHHNVPKKPVHSTPHKTNSDKDPNALPDPNRNQFDLWGNMFDYKGKLLRVGSCDPDPISKQPNPYCGRK